MKEQILLILEEADTNEDAAEALAWFFEKKIEIRTQEQVYNFQLDALN